MDSLDSNKILFTWEQLSVPKALRRVSFKMSELPSKSLLITGLSCADFQAIKSERGWIAPWVWRLEDEMIAPIWLQVGADGLCAIEPLRLHVPMGLFDPFSSVCLGDPLAFEQWLELLDETTLPNKYLELLPILDTVLQEAWGEDWKERLTAMGAVRESNQILTQSIHEVGVSQCIKEAVSLPLMQQILTGEGKPAEPDSTQAWQSISTALGYIGSATDTTRLAVKVQAHQLQDGHLMTIERPVGASAAGLFQNYVAHSVVKAALEETPCPKIGYVSVREDDLDLNLITRWSNRDVPLINKRDAKQQAIDESFFITRCQAREPSVDSLASAKALLHEELSDCVSALQKIVKAANKVLDLRSRMDSLYAAVGGLNEEWRRLQNEDAALEKKYNQIAHASLEWEAQYQRSFMDTLSKVLPFSRNRLRDRVWTFFEAYLKGYFKWEEDAFNYGEGLAQVMHVQMRQIQTQRAKKHSALVPITEAMAKRAREEKQWADWQKKYTHKHIEDPSVLFELEDHVPVNLVSYLDNALKYECYQLATHYFDAVSLETGQATFQPHAELLTPDTLNDKDAFDILFVDDAEQLTPLELVKVLSKAKKAVVMGSPAHLQATPVLSEVIERQYWARDGIDIDEIDLPIRLSRDTGYDLARRQSNESGEAVQLTQTIDQSEHLVTLLNKLSYRHHYDPAKVTDSAFLALHIKGLTKTVAGSLRNEREGELIVRWIQTETAKLHQLYPDRSIDQSICVVTPYAAQKQYLDQLLKGQVNVYDVTHAPKKMYPWVIFSPVNTVENVRPLPLDQRSEVIATALSMATHKCLVVGDLEIFDNRTHSPTGILAKEILQPGCRLDYDALIACEQMPSEAVTFSNIAALRGRLFDALQHAEKEVIILARGMDVSVIEEFNLTQTIHKATSRGVSVSLLTCSAVVDECWESKQLLAWLRAGVQVYHVPDLSTNMVLFDKEGFEMSLSPLLLKEQSVDVLHYQGSALETFKTRICKPLLAVSVPKKYLPKRTKAPEPEVV